MSKFYELHQTVDKKHFSKMDKLREHYSKIDKLGVRFKVALVALVLTVLVVAGTGLYAGLTLFLKMYCLASIVGFFLYADHNAGNTAVADLAEECKIASEAGEDLHNEYCELDCTHTMCKYPVG